jgi:hypothetical protein
LTITLYLLLLAKNRPALIQYSSIPLGFAYISRPLNNISILVLTAYVLLKYRGYFLRYMCWSLVVAAPFILFNLSAYHAVLPPYYMPKAATVNPHFFEAFFANIISPSRGLFVFSPILLFSIFGFLVRIKERQSEALDFCLVGIVIAHWIVISLYQFWWAGHSFGPRYFSDMIPYLMYFLIPVVGAMTRAGGKRPVALRAVFALLLIFSFLVHFRGATSRAVHAWNDTPADISMEPERAWDWGDAQFLRGIQ